MKKNKAIKFRLYPTKEQEEYLLQLFGCCRFVYNNSLAWSIEQYEAGNKTNYYDWAGRLTEMKKAEETKWLKEVDAQALQQALRNLSDAFKNFFQRRQQGVGYPKFKSKHNHRDSAKCLNVKLVDGKLYIPKLKTGIKTDWHRQPEEGWQLCSATLSHVPSGKYYVSCLFCYEDAVQMIEPFSFIGLDYAQHGLYVDSNGNSPELKRAFVEAEDKLAKAQRRLSRTKKGSVNHEKQRIKVARIHEHISNIRLNQLHQLSTEIANQFDCVVVEDLNVKKLGEGELKLGKNERDNGWGIFRNMLLYKLADRGKYLAVAPKYYLSSQICNNCGAQWKGTKDLSVREWTCPICGHTHNRDTNAALNLRDIGIAYFTSLEQGIAPLEPEQIIALEEEARSFS